MGGGLGSSGGPGGLSLRFLLDSVILIDHFNGRPEATRWLAAIPPRVLGVPLHAYDALVLPVLLGITVDEAMFLLYRARETGDDARATLAREGPQVATTALTTSAGFAGLIACDFDGLRHLGMVGALGSLAGLLVALSVVPAGLRLLPRRTQL